MIKLRPNTWVLPIALAALAVALIAAVFVAREKRVALGVSVVQRASAPSQRIAAPSHTGRSLGTPAFSAETTYGAGLSSIVPDPVAVLRPELGDEWRELRQVVGRLLISPSGSPSRYFEVSMVAFAPRRAARLEILTSREQRAIAYVRAGNYEVINFGPLLSANGRQRIGIAISSVQPYSAKAGDDLRLSPLQAEYLAPGEALMRMPALAEVGPAGSRGLSIAPGANARFQMTPGATGPCMVALQGASVGGNLQVTIAIGNQRRSALVRDRSAVTYIGPFSRTGGALTLTVNAPARENGSLFLSNVRFVPVPAT